MAGMKHATGIDSAEMYDEDIKKIAVMWQELGQKFGRKPNTRAVLEELEKEAIDKAQRMGYVVRVHISEKLLGIGPVTIEVMGRVAGHEYNEYGLDHEKKGWEIGRAKTDKTDDQVRSIIKGIEKR